MTTQERRGRLSLAEMRRLYVEERLSPDAIAKRCEPRISRSTVVRSLQRLGVDLRDLSGAARARWNSDEIRDVTLDRLHELRNSAAVADELGLHDSTVRQRLRAAGVTTGRSGISPRRPPIPQGLLRVEDAAPLVGLTPGALQGRCRRGSWPGATQEAHWPYRWLVPDPRIRGHRE